MPDRPIDALSKAQSIIPGAGPTLPMDLHDAITHGNLANVIRAIGLDDPLGVGSGSLQASASLASGKSLKDLLGEVLTMPKTTTSEGLSLPKRIRLSSIDPQVGTVNYHGANMTGTPMQSSASDFEKLYHEGVLQREVPPSEGLPLEDLVTRLVKVLKRAKIPTE